MKKFPYNKDRPYDEGFELVCTWIRKTCVENDDDFLLTIIGPTGTGKSRLALHGYELIAGNNATAETIAQDRNQFADALKYATDMTKPKFVLYDEANVSSRDSMTGFNKDLIDLYLAIRGDNIIHVWCNPTINMLDKHFVEERLGGCIFIFTKDQNKPRLYYYFRQTDLIKVLEKYGNLKRKTLKKAANQFAWFRGWFKDYNGFLLKDYLNKKNPRIKHKIDEFWEKYGTGQAPSISRGALAKKLNISNRTICNYEKALLEQGKLTSENVQKSPAGKVHYYGDIEPIFLQELELRRQKVEKTMYKTNN